MKQPKGFEIQAGQRLQRLVRGGQPGPPLYKRHLHIAILRAQQLKVLHRTESVPRNIVCVRSSLDASVTGALTTILLGMEGDEEGRSVLQGFEETTRFDRFPDGPESAIEKVVALLPFVEEDLGK